jgi:hypothetical protein
MDQVSRPLQILLAGVLVFAALWFVALRPKSGGGGGSTSSAASLTQTTSTPAKSAIPGGLGSAVDKARAAKTAGDAAAARSSQVGNAGTTGSATTQAPTPAASAVKPPVATAPHRQASATAPKPSVPPASGPARVRRALARGRAVVLLFSSRSGADDRHARSELTQVHRRGGRVLVISAPIRALSRYTAVLGGAQVLESPTVIVISKRHGSRLFAGYSDHTELDQAVGAALRR